MKGMEIKGIKLPQTQNVQRNSGVALNVVNCLIVNLTEIEYVKVAEQLIIRMPLQQRGFNGKGEEK